MWRERSVNGVALLFGLSLVAIRIRIMNNDMYRRDQHQPSGSVVWAFSIIFPYPLLEEAFSRFLAALALG